ncbi:MAG TPA: hypothetical protein VHM70_25685 [Polyangiaceae bacterium]|nr:hypothetical protein [Polyangiaceae bacterium]
MGSSNAQVGDAASAGPTRDAGPSAEGATGDQNGTQGDSTGSGSDDSEQGSVDGSGTTSDDASGPDVFIPAGPATITDGGVSAPVAPLPKGVTIQVDPSTDGGIQILCNGAPCACSDGEDNDGDGLVDGQDSECTGPFDGDEATFSTGIPGDNRDPKWQDCFFDGNSGAGDDGCRYHTDCLTGDLPPDDPKCTVTDQCRDLCEPLTPPGCDCFGCCEVHTGSETLHIVVSDSCSMERIDDEQACPRCEPTTICDNECGPCEICIGQTIDDLPASCFETPNVPNPPTGSGGSPSIGDGDSGAPPSGGGGGNGDGSGGAPSTPPDGQGGGPSSEPPSPPMNVCDNGATPCTTSDDCGGIAYCSLGCCKLNFVVR